MKNEPSRSLSFVIRPFISIREVWHAVRYSSVFRIFCVGVALVMALTFSGAAQAAVKDYHIEEVPGLWFENILYAWNKVTLDVVNTTPDNIMFGGTMIFLDYHGKPIAKASLLPKKISGLNSERYTAHFIEGSGEAARRAVRVIWDFGTL